MDHKKILLNLKELVATIVTLTGQIQERFEAALFDDVLQQQVDLLIDGIVAMNQSLQTVLAQDPDAALQALFDEVADQLVTIISGFEQQDIELIRATYLGPFTEKFPLLAQALNYYIENRIKKQVVVIGVNEWSVDVGHLLDSEKAEIVAFVSDKPELQGKTYRNIPILSSLEGSGVPYDLLIAAEPCSYQHEEKPVLDLVGMLDTHYDFETFRAMSHLIEADRDVEAFVTGLSYAEVGIDVDELPYKTLNLAVSSQDLFYDYQIAKRLLSNEQVRENVKLVIIGLAYYSFEFDLSKGRLKNKTAHYYPFFKTLHHHEADPSVLESFDKFEELALTVFHKDYLATIYQLLGPYKQSWWENLVSGTLDQERIDMAEMYISMDCDKDYPLTVEENVQTLKEYVEFLLAQNIEVAFVVCPTSNYYHPLFSARLKDNFLTIIEQFKKEYPPIKVLDYFDSADFEDEDFYDVSHLNTRGAKKLTAQLRRDLSSVMEQGEIENGD